MKHIRILSILALIATAHTPANLLASETQEKYNRISLSAKASVPVMQDELRATLYASSRGDNAKETATKVSIHMQKALSIIDQEQNIESQTGNFTTEPVYKRQRIIGWQSRQTVHLKSRDATALSQLLSRLQDHLKIESIHYGISEQRLKTAKDKLIEQAIKNFQQRAQLLARSMRSEKYRLVEMHVNTDDHGYVQSGAMMSKRADMEVAPPIQAGTQRVQVNISGTIELQI